VYNRRVQQTTLKIFAKGETMATETHQLESFVKKSLQSGKTREEIAKALEGAGRPGAQIASALDAFSESTVGCESTCARSRAHADLAAGRF
jgi:hypothetical protein